MSETVEVDGEEVLLSDISFVSLTGKGLVIQHQGWAEEELQGPGEVPPDPMDFGDTESYDPNNVVEAKELLGHPHRSGNVGAGDWFALYKEEDGDVVEEDTTQTGSPGELTEIDDEDVSTKQEALEALAEADIDLSGGDVTPTSTKQEILDFAEEQGFVFPTYG